MCTWDTALCALDRTSCCKPSVCLYRRTGWRSGWDQFPRRPRSRSGPPHRRVAPAAGMPRARSKLFQTAQRAAWRNQERSIQPTPCAQTEQPWILRPLPRRRVSRSQPGCRQPRKLREGSFQADKGAGAEASRLEPPHRS